MRSNFADALTHILADSGFRILELFDLYVTVRRVDGERRASAI